MTIIKPKEKMNNVKFVLFLAILIILGGVVYIFEYNELVEMRYQVKALKQKIEQIELKNIELKNETYSITDPKVLMSLVSTFSLIEEKKPKYLGFGGE